MFKSLNFVGYLSCLMVCMTAWTPSGNVVYEHNDVCASVTDVPQSECHALMSIYTYLEDGKQTALGRTWGKSTAVCSWNGIICEGGHVTELKLVGHRISGELSPAIGGLTELQHLSLIRTWLTELPDEIGYLKNLITLDLSDSPISELPSEIGNLSNLEELDLSYQCLVPGGSPNEMLLRMSIMPRMHDRALDELEKVAGLEKLRALNLSGNGLDEVPGFVYELKALEVLYLERNQLKYLPRRLGWMPALRELYLGENQIKRLPLWMGPLGSLEVLDWSDNPIQSR